MAAMIPVPFYKSDYQDIRKEDRIQVVLKEAIVMTNGVNLIFQLADSFLAQKKLNKYLKFDLFSIKIFVKIFYSFINMVLAVMIIY